MANDQVCSASSATRRLLRSPLKPAPWLMMALLLPLAACSQPSGNVAKDEKKMSQHQEKKIYFDITLFSYLERPIFDVYVNGRDIGVAGPFGGGGLMTGVPITPGPQVITWRDAGTGEAFKATNIPVLQNIDQSLSYLGVHIYPDNTVELIPERYWPEPTEKGSDLHRKWKHKNGQ